MKRLGDTLRAMNRSNILSHALIEAQVFSAWENTVGHIVKENTDPQKFKNGILFVKTKNPSWAHELKALSASIKEKINQAIGTDIVYDIRFLHDSSRAETGVVDQEELSPKLDLIKLSVEELRQIDELVYGIEQDDLRYRLKEILIKDKKLNKWRRKTRQS